jgi:hypothetical protein
MTMTMNTSVDRPNRRRRNRPVDPSPSSASQHLRTAFAPARVSFTWFGVRKGLSADQKAQAAESFGAEGQYLTAAKKLLDTGHAAFQAVNSLRNQIQVYWRELSLPYPETGVRLLRQQDVEPFNRRMHQFKAELEAAVLNLDHHYAELRTAAQDRLGSLYNPADYPPSLRGLFAVEWDFPSTEPPEYLLRLNPQIFEQERARMQARFEEAVHLAEQAFVAEFGKLVEHLVDRLTGTEDGRRKTFRDSAVTNLAEFFNRFRALSVRSNADLDRLIETAQRAIQGVGPQAIRDNDDLRQHVANQFANVQASLDDMLVDRPRRRILRPANAPEVRT